MLKTDTAEKALELLDEGYTFPSITDETGMPPAVARKMVSPHSLPVTLDDWHIALGIYSCVGCGVHLLKGTKQVWQGRNRWCEACFWGEDSEGDVSKVPT